MVRVYEGLQRAEEKVGMREGLIVRRVPMREQLHLFPCIHHIIVMV